MANRRGMKWLIPLLALVALLPQRASAETTLGPAITTLPITLSKAGVVYHFTKNLVYDSAVGTAIDIAGSDIVIDMNGYALINTTGSNNTANGIVCNSFNRVSVKNGSVVGFLNGVALTSEGAQVENLLVTNNFRTGIIVIGNNANIVNNRVNATGGSVNSAFDSFAAGISLTGTYCNISDNEVHSTYTADITGRFGNGIRLNGCSNIVVSNNHVLDVEPIAPTEATTTGIATVSSDNLIILNNVVASTQVGFDLSGGASGSYGDNITSTVATGYFTSGSGMTSIGNNN